MDIMGLVLALAAAFSNMPFHAQALYADSLHSLPRCYINGEERPVIECITSGFAVDVPATQVETDNCFAKYEGCFVRDDKGDAIAPLNWWEHNYTGTAHFWVWSCTDKSRILLTDESGNKHCVKF